MGIISMSASKKDYVAISGCLAKRHHLYASMQYDLVTGEVGMMAVEKIAIDLADLFGSMNPEFRREEFLRLAVEKPITVYYASLSGR
jgi:hypothetical protein